MKSMETGRQDGGSDKNHAPFSVGKTGNISRKFLTIILKIFDKNFERLHDRVTFQKGDAAKLDFADGTFDAAVSNFVFHEVHSAKDKRDVVREALRVLKKGGAFSFQDMFSQEALYGDMDAFVKQLKAEGISEIHYIGNLEKKLDAIPGYVTTPWMISGMGIIYGKK